MNPNKKKKAESEDDVESSDEPVKKSAPKSKVIPKKKSEKEDEVESSDESEKKSAKKPA